MIIPKENVSAVTLRSGKTMEAPPNSQQVVPPKEATPKDEKAHSKPPKASLKPSILYYVTPPPFPSRLVKSKNEEDKEILETFRKVEVTYLFLMPLSKCLTMPSFLKSYAPPRRSTKVMRK